MLKEFGLGNLAPRSLSRVATLVVIAEVLCVVLHMHERLSEFTLANQKMHFHQLP